MVMNQEEINLETIVFNQMLLVECLGPIHVLPYHTLTTTTTTIEYICQAVQSPEEMLIKTAG